MEASRDRDTVGTHAHTSPLRKDVGLPACPSLPTPQASLELAGGNSGKRNASLPPARGGTYDISASRSVRLQLNRFRDRQPLGAHFMPGAEHGATSGPMPEPP